MKPGVVNDAIVEEITIRASAKQIFEALTDPAQMVKWWGIEGRFQATHVESSLRPAGEWLMRGTRQNGQAFTIRGTYREVDPPRTLVFTWLPDWQEDLVETVVRIDLAERNGVTTVRLTHSGLSTDTSRAAHRGWPELLDALRAYAELTQRRRP
jgi:uncharacterized protein YndB with AHSA1/START domain